MPSDIQPILQSHSGNTTALQTIIGPIWADAPSYRGTSQILWSCLLTLIACVYNALHLNIPAPDRRGSWHMFKRKLLWIIIALLAPEVVVYTASMQYLRARWLQRQLRKEIPLGPVRDQCSSMRYCFFVVMGGLAVELSEFLSLEEIEKIHRVLADTNRKKVIFGTLSCEGLIQLARLGYYFPVSEERINDRSKAGHLQKLLVLGQVGWMALQCIVRKTYGLPLALLEIHVLVHVVCAAVMYACWFGKPLDIQEPEFVDNQASKDVLMFMLEKELEAQFETKAHIFSPRDNEAAKEELRENPFLLYTESQWPKYYGVVLSCGVGFEILVNSDQDLENARNLRDRYISEFLGDKRIQRFEAIGAILDRLASEKGTRRQTGPLESVGLMGHDEDYFHCGFCLPGGNFLSGGYIVLENSRDELEDVKRRVGTFFYWERDNTFRAKWLALLILTWLFILPVIYGAVHLAAWRFHFPTKIEGLLWKISCLAVMGGIPAVPVLALYGLVCFGILRFMCCLMDTEGREHFSWNHGAGGLIWAHIGVMGILTAGLVLVYTASRAFIVLESFLSLRESPIGVYSTPAWVQMMPHF
ncbi:hypothetical protein QBC38DRAFT_420222 [Podospora fimiseda]|uniref:Uncharacterized protein n=1 Tax=Podospora fimiseda TaxID=252190 RepID=A0AAN7BMB7_9PEZI|nr:hypothetical protein QBC38DRAFT_420222 [Podospora fimiseda]